MLRGRLTVSCNGIPIITSKLPISKWHEVIDEKTITDAILDRIVHDAHRIELKG
jgi:DNA replication protein DnaC